MTLAKGTKLAEMEVPEVTVLQDLSRVSTAKRTARLVRDTEWTVSSCADTFDEGSSRFQHG